MELFEDIIIAVAVLAAGFAVLWTLKGALLTPVRRREDADVFTVIRASGDAGGLEQAVRGLAWLRDAGRAEVCLVIADDGLTQEAALRAALLAERNGAAFCRWEEMLDKTEELRWRKNAQQ